MSGEPELLNTKGVLRGPQAAYAYAQARRHFQTVDYLRETVLRYPDLAERLTKPPIEYATTRTWNGYVAPSMTAAESGARIVSARRDALIELCCEAITRARGPADASDWRQLMTWPELSYPQHLSTAQGV